MSETVSMRSPYGSIEAPKTSRVTIAWCRSGPTEIMSIGTPDDLLDAANVLPRLGGQVAQVAGVGDVLLPAGQLLVDRLRARHASRSRGGQRGDTLVIQLVGDADLDAFERRERVEAGERHGGDAVARAE
jgi:hypothetical protein